MNATKEAEETYSCALNGYSIEMTGKDIDRLEAAANFMPKCTQVSITYLPNETHAARIAATKRVRALGLLPVPHISVRRLASHGEAEGFLEQLVSEAQVNNIFVIAGDLAISQGPYEDSLAFIRSGLIERYGIKHVSIAGHPDGHPVVAKPVLWQALADKQKVLDAIGIESSIMTQFGFDANAMLHWLAEARNRGVDAPVRLGVAGPSSVATLMKFAARCGVGASATVLAKYGLSITKLLGKAGPEHFLEELASGYSPELHGKVDFHFFPFGGLEATVKWVADAQQKHAA